MHPVLKNKSNLFIVFLEFTALERAVKVNQ